MIEYSTSSYRNSTVDSATMKKLDCLRVASNASMLAAFISLFATVILSALAGFRYLPSATPIFSVTGFIVLLITCVILDCTLRSVAQKNHVDLAAYFRERQPTPVEETKKKKSKIKS